MRLRLFLFFFLPICLSAQSEFSNIYTPNTAAHFNCIETLADGSMIVGGYDKNAVTQTSYFLFKINPLGEVEWSRKYDQEVLGNLTNIQVDANESITLFGETNCGSGQGLFVSNLAPNGNINWSRSFDNNADFYARDFTTSNTGGFIIGGTDYDFTMAIGKIAANGDLNWGKTFRRPGLQNLNGLFENEANEIIFYGDFKSGMSVPSRALIGKLSATGNLAWLKSYTTATQNANDDSFIAGINTDDQGYFFVGKRRVAAKLDVLMTKTDSSGNVQWSYSFGALETELVFDVKKGNDCFYIIGRTSNYHPFYQYQVYKIGLDGTYLWGRQFGLPGDSQFNIPAFSIGQDDLMQVMINTDSDIEKGAWVFTLDKDGISSCLIDTLNFITTNLNPVVEDHPVLEGSFFNAADCGLARSTFDLSTTLTCQYVAADFDISAEVICAGQCVDLTNTSIIFPNTFAWEINGGSPNFSNEENPADICFYNPGIYEITLIASNEYNSDTLTQTIEVLEAPDFIAYNDSLICPGDSLLITADLTDVLEYEWSTGGITASIEVDTGLYIFTASTSLCEDYMDSVYVDYFAPLNNLNIGNSTTLCEEEILTLEIEPQDFVTYTWSNGATGATTNINESGVYSLTATGNCEMAMSNEIMVEFEDCSCPYKVPNAFTPDGDGNNDFFRISADCELISFDLEIWNRWGQKVASLDAGNPEWDGNFNGRMSPSDVYIYVLEGVLESKAGPRAFMERGNLTLIR